MNTPLPPPEKPVLVLGATGYIGGRLVPMLLDRGFSVRAGVRSTGKILCRPFAAHPAFAAVRTDVLDYASVQAAVEGVHTVYFLVHSMQKSGADFGKTDRIAAENVARAAAQAGVERIVYLGGLGEDTQDLSEHLRSRREVGKILSAGAVPVTWFRAAMILGSGSASFEIMRHLVERLPVMLTPSWVRTKSQPIAVSNVLDYLIGAPLYPETAGRIFDIGGPDVLSYEELFDVYSEEAGLKKRLVIAVPMLTPGLSSYWISLITPVHAGLARPLAEGLKNEVVCTDDCIVRTIIPTKLLSCREAIRLAVQQVRERMVDTCWSDAGYTRPPEWLTCGDAPFAGGTVYECSWIVELGCPPEAVWKRVQSLGGREGWLYAQFLWEIRGFMDKLVGGVGLRRGRRDPEDLKVGDALDFFRVVDLVENEKLLLQAEMKTPGEAVLQFSLEPKGLDKTALKLISRFFPKGLFGQLYWWSMYIPHIFLFSGILRTIAEKSGCRILKAPVPFKDEGRVCRLHA